METSILNGMCRCCALEGTFKDLKCTYHWMGEQEIYGDMLKECFNIDLSNEDGTDSGICEVCITQLRNAVNFKKQVLFTEEQFKKKVQGKFFKANIVKLEVQQDEADSDDNDNNLSTDEAFSNTEFEVPIKMEEPEEPKAKKRAAAKATTSRAKKAKTDAGETSKRTRSTDRIPVPIIIDEDKTETLTLNRKLNFSSFITIRPGGKKASPSVRERHKKICTQKRLTELDWHFDNIRTILKCSNATPMRCQVGSRYACSYCLDQFDNPGELRSHTISKHDNDKPEFFNLRSLSKHIVYLDITSLFCVVCNESVATLDALMDHLKHAHDELIHKQIKNQIVPYKYDGSIISCGVCNDDVSCCPDLQDHMARHYRNFKCEFCSLTFMIRMRMIEHKKNVHRV